MRIALLLSVTLCACGMMPVTPDSGTPDAGIPDAGPHVMLPDCGTPDPDAGTYVDIYNNVVILNGCNAGGCHGPAGFIYMFNTADEMRTVWIDAGAQEAPMKRVSPGNLDQSYVMYKVLGQQTVAGGSGDQMPQGQDPLTTPQMCALANWIRAGAP